MAFLGPDGTGHLPGRLSLERVASCPPADAGARFVHGAQSVRPEHLAVRRWIATKLCRRNGPDSGWIPVVRDRGGPGPVRRCALHDVLRTENHRRTAGIPRRLSVDLRGQWSRPVQRPPDDELLEAGRFA